MKRNRDCQFSVSARELYPLLQNVKRHLPSFENASILDMFTNSCSVDKYGSYRIMTYCAHMTQMYMSTAALLGKPQLGSTLPCRLSAKMKLCKAIAPLVPHIPFRQRCRISAMSEEAMTNPYGW